MDLKGFPSWVNEDPHALGSPIQLGQRIDHFVQRTRAGLSPLLIGGLDSQKSTIQFDIFPLQSKGFGQDPDAGINSHNNNCPEGFFGNRF